MKSHNPINVPPTSSAMAQTCDGCQLSTVRPELLVTTRKSFSREKIRLCPACRQGEYRDAQRALWKMYLIIGVLCIGLTLITGDRVRIFALMKAPVIILCFAGMMFLCVFLHELGHAVASYVCRWEIRGFCMGFGRLLWQRCLGRVVVQLRIFQIGGYVDVKPRQISSFLIPQAFFIFFAGPATNLVLASIFYFLKLSMKRDSEIETNALLPEIFSFGVLINVTLFALNLIPFQVGSGPLRFGSDGFNLMRMIFSPRQFAKQYEEESLIFRLDYLRKIGDEEAAAAMLAEAQPDSAEEMYILGVHITDHLESGRLAEAEQCCRHGLEKLENGDLKEIYQELPSDMLDQVTAHFDCYFKSCLALARAQAGDDPEGAWKLASEINEKYPWDAWAKAAYGYALVGIDRIDEGIAALQYSVKKMDDETPAARQKIIGYIRAIKEWQVAGASDKPKMDLG